MTASVTRRRREDEEKNLAEQVEFVKISYFSVHLYIGLLMHIIIAYLLGNAYITIGQEVEVRVVGQGGKTLNRLLVEISPEELLAVDSV